MSTVTTPPDHNSSDNHVSQGLLLLVIAGGTVAGATQTNDTGPILTFVGALIVVVITAVTTNRRQARQLSAEGERHRDSLRAEGERQATSLQAESERLDRRQHHERLLINLDHLRQMLDMAAAAYETTHQTMILLEVSLRQRNREVESAIENQDTETKIRERAIAAVDAAKSVSTQLRRLEIRVPKTHPIFVGYSDVENAVAAWVDHALDRKATGMTADDSQAGSALAGQAVIAFSSFAEAARAEVGSTEARADAAKAIAPSDSGSAIPPL
jgi:hypothetical protein